MARRVRVRSLSDGDLSEALTTAVVDYMMADADEAWGAADRVGRLHREWSRRHVGSMADGCTCAQCFGRVAALEG